MGNHRAEAVVSLLRHNMTFGRVCYHLVFLLNCRGIPMKCGNNPFYLLQDKSMSLSIHVVYNRDMNADRNGPRLPAWLHHQPAFICPWDFLPSCRPNCIVKERFIMISHYLIAIMFCQWKWDLLGTNKCWWYQYSSLYKHLLLKLWIYYFQYIVTLLDPWNYVLKTLKMTKLLWKVCFTLQNMKIVLSGMMWYCWIYIVDFKRWN